jgi:hypothetical protein
LCCIAGVAGNAGADPNDHTLTVAQCSTSADFVVGGLFACDGLLTAQGASGGDAFMTYDSNVSKFKMYGAGGVLKLTFEPTISSFSFNSSLNNAQLGTIEIVARDAGETQVGSTVTNTGAQSITGAAIKTVTFTTNPGANGFLAFDFLYTPEGSVTGCADCSGNEIEDYDGDLDPDATDPDDDNDGVPDTTDTDDQNVNVCGVDEDDDTCDDCSAGGSSPSTVTDGVNSDSDPDGLCDAFDRKTLNFSACTDDDLDALFACDGLASGLTEAEQPVINSSGMAPANVIGADITLNFDPPVSRVSFVVDDSSIVTPFSSGTVNGATLSSGNLTEVTFDRGDTVVVTGTSITSITIATDTLLLPSWFITELALDPVERVVGCDATCTGTPLDDLDGDEIPDGIDDDIDGDTALNEDDPLPENDDICGLDEDEDTCDDCLGDGREPDESTDGIDSDQDGICDLGDNRPLVEVHEFPGELDEIGCGGDGGVVIAAGIDRNGNHELDGEVTLPEPDPSPLFSVPLPPVDQTSQEIYHVAVVCNPQHLLFDHDFVEPGYQCPAGGVEMIFVMDANRNGYIDLHPDPGPVPPFVYTPNELPEYDYVYMSTVLCHGINAHIESSELPNGNEVCPTGGVHVTFSLEALQLGAPVLPGSPVFQNGGPGPLPEPVSYDICNGANSLVTVEPVTPGSKYCKNGGYIAEMGTDLDGSGSFNDEEPFTSSPICHGLNSLVAQTALEPGDASCPTGGVKVESGLDDDGDLVLATDEVDATEYVCNGADSITRTTAIESGSEACPTGGRQVEIGKDTDGDGTLDDGEVSSTELICNGSGLAVRSTRLATGNATCPGGGVVVETGIDIDGDRTLDDSEVQSEETLCDAVNALFDTETLAEDPDVCAHGGIRVKMGRDDGLPTGNAANNLLEAGEVEATRDVCLASTDVLVNGGSSECSMSPGGSSPASRWASLGTLLVLGLGLSRRGRRGASREESRS